MDATPRVSVITPCLNSVRTIEAAIRSVLDQNYPNLEYLVVDGGSTDGTVEVIRRYADRLAGWESERDRGQSHAINKGFARATGEIVAWLNADDRYLPGAIRRAVRALSGDPSAAFVYGNARVITPHGVTLSKPGPMTLPRMMAHLHRRHIPQPTVFLRNRSLKEAGPIDESLHLSMDLDLWTRLLMRGRALYLPGPPLAEIRFDRSVKTAARLFEGGQELLAVSRRAPFGSRLAGYALLRLALGEGIERRRWGSAAILLLRALSLRPDLAFWGVEKLCSAGPLRSTLPSPFRRAHRSEPKAGPGAHGLSPERAAH